MCLLSHMCHISSTSLYVVNRRFEETRCLHLQRCKLNNFVASRRRNPSNRPRSIISLKNLMYLLRCITDCDPAHRLMNNLRYIYCLCAYNILLV
jgi:hypothetical protein